MKIAFTGAQGVGKTTLLDILEKCFKFKEPVTYVRNLTRLIAESGTGINASGDDNTQLAVMQAHKRFIDLPSTAIVDRCVVDGLVYTYYLYRHGKISDEVLTKCIDFFKDYISSYDLIFYIKPEFPITGDKYRSSDVAYQKEIADIFDEVINKYNVPVIQLTGTVGDRLSTVLKHIGDLLC